MNEMKKTRKKTDELPAINVEQIVDVEAQTALQSDLVDEKVEELVHPNPGVQDDVLDAIEEIPVEAIEDLEKTPVESAEAAQDHSIDQLVSEWANTVPPTEAEQKLLGKDLEEVEPEVAVDHSDACCGQGSWHVKYNAVRRRQSPAARKYSPTHRQR